MPINSAENKTIELSGLVLHKSGQLDERAYYYSADPHRLLVVLRNGLALDDISGYGTTVDVAIGRDEGIKYVAPHNVGKTHTKITVFRILPGVHDKTAMRLSATMTKAPKNPGRPQIGRTPTKPRTITLPLTQWQQADTDGNGNASRGVRAWHSFRQQHAQLFDHDREQEDDTTMSSDRAPSLSSAVVVRPAEPITATIAWLTIDGNTIRVLFPEKRDDFRSAVKRLEYTWGNPYWQREFSAKVSAETILHRAAELAHNLLAAGFCVAPPTVAVRNLAINADYDPEPRRVIKAITTGQYAGWFALIWPYEDDLYNEASSLPAARYNKPYVVVPPEHFAAVLDFAKTYRFTLSAAARELAAQAQALEDSALIATSLPPVSADHPPQWQRPDLDADTLYAIDDALLDDALLDDASFDDDND